MEVNIRREEDSFGNITISVIGPYSASQKRWQGLHTKGTVPKREGMGSQAR
jgi:hypothetical protein